MSQSVAGDNLSRIDLFLRRRSQDFGSSCLRRGRIVVFGSLCIAKIQIGHLLGVIEFCKFRFAGIRECQVFFVGRNRHGTGGRTGILCPGLPGQVRNGNLAFDVVVQDLSCGKIRTGPVGNGNFRTAVGGKDSAVSGAGNTAGQVNLAALGVNIFHNEALGLGVIVHLDHIFVGVGLGIIYGLVTVVDLIQGTAVDGHFAAVVLHAFNVRITQGVFRDIHHVFAVAALDQAVYVNIRCSQIHAVPGNAARRIIRLRRCDTDRAILMAVYCLIKRPILPLVGRNGLVQVLGTRADVHNAVDIVLGDAAAGRNQLHHTAVHIRRRIHAVADGNIPLLVFNADQTVTVVDVAKDRHIRNEGILPLLVIAFYPEGIAVSDLGIIQYGNAAFPAGGCIAVQFRKFRFFARILVQFINLFLARFPGT